MRDRCLGNRIREVLVGTIGQASQRPHFDKPKQGGHRKGPGIARHAYRLCRRQVDVAIRVGPDDYGAQVHTMDVWHVKVARRAWPQTRTGRKLCATRSSRV